MPNTPTKNHSNERGGSEDLGQAKPWEICREKANGVEEGKEKGKSRNKT